MGTESGGLGWTNGEDGAAYVCLAKQAEPLASKILNLYMCIYDVWQAKSTTT